MNQSRGFGKYDNIRILSCFHASVCLATYNQSSIIMHKIFPLLHSLGVVSTTGRLFQIGSFAITPPDFLCSRSTLYKSLCA